MSFHLHVINTDEVSSVSIRNFLRKGLHQNVLWGGMSNLLTTSLSDVIPCSMAGLI
jgi:hypothetical protein